MSIACKPCSADLGSLASGVLMTPLLPGEKKAWVSLRPKMMGKPSARQAFMARTVAGISFASDILYLIASST